MSERSREAASEALQQEPAKEGPPATLRWLLPWSELQPGLSQGAVKKHEVVLVGKGQQGEGTSK